MPVWVYPVIASFLLAGVGAFVLAVKKWGADSVTDKQDKQRASIDEKRLDIANKPDASVDDVVVWLSDSRPK